MLWAALLLPTLALDAALRERPAVAGAFALVHGPAQQRRLVAVNAAAHAAGLRRGQRLAQAEVICHDLLTAEYDAQQTRAALARVAAHAYGYSSSVLLDPPNTVALEVGKSLNLFGPWPQLAARLRRELVDLGFHHRIALAPNPHAARVLANMRDGAGVTTAADLPQALASIPVSHAGIPGKAAKLLSDMGMTTLGKVMALPRAALRRRCGPEPVEVIAILLGERPGQLTPYQPPDRFTARIDLGCEVQHVHGLLFALKRMLTDLAAFLSARDSGVQRFIIHCLHADAPATVLVVGLLAPERQAAALFEVTKLRLEQLVLPAPVLELVLQADELTAFMPAATDLFDRRTSNTLPWPQLQERLRARLGEDAVHELHVTADPRPEHAWSDTDNTHPAPQQWPRRPAWLLPEPVPLHDTITRILAGPERIESGWWDGNDVRRDYYVLELAAGQRAWAFCPPGRRGPYMLHGWFA
ncbi:MAG TPA: DNA polymerase Y family protein, partial [Salinisphaeraceae bacterium]|nr:DNA polymerase Y family protein [Salinisphaeraceae bacterium]